ncbi:hypothetical protein [Williamsia sterculiae]|uniref:TY-Chap C-terminal domain-containing protein n=1 Tax=Williamsia sterculiae TaxID=1344003 RepID=A0A1N7GP08_9NOCA|nr:hypothetical protein [Williamsia sterculiae]SIS14303.1 hypothetical protein SAMN05445060_2943 [Williamsia sterculiae]
MPQTVVADLERLMTLTRAQLRAIDGPDADVIALVEHSRDEQIELCELADLAADRDDEETARHHEQEAAAWRETARLLTLHLALRHGVSDRTSGVA